MRSSFHPSRPNRLCFVSASYPPVECGIADYTGNLRRAVGEQWETPWLVTSSGAAADARTVTVPAWNGRGVLRAVAALDEIDPDLVHLQYPGKPYGHRPEPALLPWLHTLSRRRQRPWLTTLHEFRIAHPLRKAAVVALALGSDGLIFGSETERQSMVSRLPRLHSRSCVIPVPGAIPVMLPDDRAVWRRRWGIPESAVVVCHFGIVQPNKGVEELLEAAALAAAETPALHLLMLAGLQPDQSTYHAVLARRSSATPLAGRVHWTGYLPAAEVSQAFHASDLCVQPYLDGLSARRTSFVSAADHGLPVVTTRGPQTHLDFDLHHGHEVLFVDLPVRPSALAQAMSALAHSVELRRRLGESVRHAVGDRTWSTVAAKTLACYERLLAGKPLGEEGPS